MKFRYEYYMYKLKSINNQWVLEKQMNIIYFKKLVLKGYAKEKSDLRNNTTQAFSSIFNYLPSDRLFPYDSLFLFVDVGLAILSGFASASSYSNGGAPIAFRVPPFVVNKATINHTAVSISTAFKINVRLLRKNIV